MELEKELSRNQVMISWMKAGVRESLLHLHLHQVTVSSLEAGVTRLEASLGEASREKVVQERQQVMVVSMVTVMMEQAELEAEQRRLREKEEELGLGLANIKERLHRQEVTHLVLSCSMKMPIKSALITTFR